MMNFRTINDAVITLLGNTAAGRYRVVQFNRQGHAAEEIKNNNRVVQSFYSYGEFPKGKGRVSGSAQHDITIDLQLQVSAPARLNLSLINNPTSTVQQIASALSAMQEAAAAADILFDELTEIVYQTLMAAENVDLGLPVGTVSNRWVNSISKDSPQPNGELVMLTGVLQYACSTVEIITGETGTPLDEDGGFDTVLDIVGDNVERTGVYIKGGS